MLTFEESRKILQAHIKEQNLTLERRIGLTDWTAQGEFCFAFKIESLAYIESGGREDVSAGAGATLVDSRNGQIIFMSNNGCMENYEKRGNPYNGLSGVLHISGTYVDGLRQDAFKYLRKVTSKTIVEAKDLIDSIVAGEVFTFDTNAWREVEVLDHMACFEKLGYTVRRLTTFEAYPDREKRVALDEA